MKKQVFVNAKQVEDFYFDHPVTHLSLDKEGEIRYRKVYSKRPSPNVTPQTGCIIVLDHSSIPARSLFEASGYKVEANYFCGNVGAFTYCRVENLEEATVALLTSVKEVVTKAIAEKQYEMNKYEKILKAVEEQIHE